MNHPFVFLCPICFSEDSILKSCCTVCQNEIEIGKGYVTFGNQKISFANYYDLLVTKLAVKQPSNILTPEIDLQNSNDVLRVSKKAILRQGNHEVDFNGYHDLFQRVIEKPENIAEGFLTIFENSVEFISERKKFRWHADEFACVTTNGHYFEFKIKHQPFFQIQFLHESRLKYEIIFRKWVRRFYGNRGESGVIEFQPRITFSPPRKTTQLWNFAGNKRSEKEYFLERVLLNFVEFVVRSLLRLWIKVQVISRENWETAKTGFTILNHHSALDPFIVGAFLDRKIAFLTKSTSFNSGLLRFFLKWLRGIPTTRYQTDPHVVYLIRGLFRNGIKVGIFPEGERTWGGKMHPFKLSVVKLLMASKEAITPIVLKNVYQFWPRWAKLPRRAAVQILVGAPFCLIPQIYSVDEQREWLEEYFRMQLGED